MNEPAVITEQRGKVLILTLNRPHKLNALNQDIKKGLSLALGRAAGDESVSAVVLTGAGRAFSAGGDLKVFAKLYEDGDPAAREEFTAMDFPRMFFDFPKPVIAAVNGPAVGWGFTVSLACDLRLASREAVFAAGFVRAGVTPEFGSSALLPRMVGLGKALELVLTARQVPAGEAMEMGILTEVTEPEDLLDRAMELAAKITAHSAPAIRLAKRLLYQGAESTLDKMLEVEMATFREAMATPEHYDSVRALLEMVKKH